MTTVRSLIEDDCWDDPIKRSFRALAVIRSGNNPETLPTGFDTVCVGDLAVIVGKRKPKRPHRSAIALKAAVADRRVLEILHDAGTALPVDPNAPAASAAALRALLTRQSELIARTLDTLAGRSEFQLLVRWDPKEAIRSARNDVADRSLYAIATSAESQRQALFEATKDSLTKSGCEWVERPCDDVATIGHLSLLTAPDGASALEQQLSRLDDANDGRLHIRLIGPLPAISFCQLRLHQIEKSTLTSIQHTIGPDALGSPRAFEIARRRAIMARASNPASASWIAKVSRLLRPLLDVEEPTEENLIGCIWRLGETHASEFENSALSYPNVDPSGELV